MDLLNRLMQLHTVGPDHAARLGIWPLQITHRLVTGSSSAVEALDPQLAHVYGLSIAGAAARSVAKARWGSAGKALV